MKEIESKIIVWDFFGGTQNSVYEALKDYVDYEVYTFDITPPTRQKHFYVDLSSDDCIIKINKLNIPEPDVMVFSPPCDSFSSVLSMRGGGTVCWVERNGRLEYRSKADFEINKTGFHRYLDYSKQLDRALLGEKLLNNSLKIIKYFKPKSWYIENPRTSLMWKYIMLNTDFCNVNSELSIFNRVKYGNYGFPTPKATIFLSNIDLNLNNDKVIHDGVNYVEGEKWKRGKNHLYSLARSNFGGIGKSRRSEIPKKLIREIFYTFKENGVN